MLSKNPELLFTLKNVFLISTICLLPLIISGNTYASGMKLETSVVVVNTDEGEGVMSLSVCKPVAIQISTGINWQ